MQRAHRTISVVHTIDSLRADHGGPSRSVTHLCTALAGLGQDVRIVSQRDDRDIAPSLLPKDSRVLVSLVRRQAALPMFFRPASRFIRALEREISAAHDAIIHNHGIWMLSNHVTAHVAFATRRPFVVSIRGMLTSWALNRQKVKKRAAWMAYQRRDLARAGVLHATSGAEVEDIRRAGINRPVALIPNGVAIPEGARALPANGVPRRALFLSRLHPIKGVISLVQAWSKARPPGWTLTLAGPAENGYRAEVEDAIRHSGLEDEITMPGAIADSAKWEEYRRSDLFILPTLSESFGIVVAEALASGIPVITTKAAPWHEMKHRECGWWIDVGVEPLARAIREATSLSDEQRVEMGRRGRKLIVDKYSWTGVAEDMLEVYLWMLGKGRRPDCVVT